MKPYICIDIGGTAIKYGVIENEKIIEKAVIDTPKGGPKILEKTKEIIETYLKRGSYGGVCISTAGMVDVENGRIFHAADTIPDFKGTEFKKEIETSFKITCEIENDVNCAGLAESISGAGKGCKSILCLTIGTGIGGCAVIGGEVLHGFTGSACEIGYMRIPGGVFEKLGAASILTQKVAEKKGEDRLKWSGIHIFEEAKKNDKICIEAIDEMCDVLGLGIANLCYILNPQKVVLGGGIMAQEDYLYPRIRKAMDKYLIPVLAENTELAMAEHKNNAGMLGAYYHFMKRQQKRGKL